MKIYSYSFLLFASILLIQSCAQIVQPNGGTIDAKAPALKAAMPAQNATNVNTQRFELKFNEYISINDAAAQLLVSPPLNSTPELILQNKTLIIKIKDTLRANTTYAFNFGNSISDITENNKAEDFKYIFATGNFIDSLKLSGTVNNALTQLPEKGVFVMLYENATDSTPMKRKPNYFAKTNESGTYTITNIKACTYSVFALKDGNNDLMYNQTNENIGFNSNNIDIKKDTLCTLLLFNEGNEKQYIKRNNSDPGYIKLVLNKPSKTLIIKRTDNLIAYSHIRQSAQNDTIELWHNSQVIDSTQLVVTTDAKTDTLAIVYKVAKPTIANARSGKETNSILSTTNISIGGVLDIDKNIAFTTRNPIKEWDETKFTAFYVNDTLKKDTIKLQLAVVKKDDFTLTITNKLPTNKTIKLKLLPKAIADCIGNVNDTIGFVFKVNAAELYGNFKLMIEPKDMQQHYVLYLMKDEKKISTQLLNPKNALKNKYTISYNNLLAGEYSAQLVIDNDANGKWTTGNYLQHVQPETIIKYNGRLNFKANWDTENTWKLQ
jgi:uncharacterized protein (DUF2141 family)